MQQHNRAIPRPESFPADWEELYVGKGLSVVDLADALSVRYGRTVSDGTVLKWAGELGFPRRKSSDRARADAAKRRRPSLNIVTVAHVERAEAAGEIARTPAAPEAPLDIPFDQASPAHGGFRFAELGDRQCRWCTSPHNAAATAFRFCGAPQVLGKPYCEEHQAAAYRKPTESERRVVKEGASR